MPTPGKGGGTVLPNLLAADLPVVCVDPKGENAHIAATARRRFGPAWVLDPFGASGLPASGYDPAAVIDPHSPDLADDAATLADALVHDPPGQVAEAHWNEEVKALIAGLLMHLACKRGRGGSENRPEGLPALRRLLTLPPREWDALLSYLMAGTGAAGGLVARAAARKLGKADREAAGVLSSAQRHTHLLDSPRLAAMMARSDFHWRDLCKGSATVFLVLPPDRMGAQGTVQYETSSHSTSTLGFSFNGQGGPGSTSEGTSTHLTGRALLSPDEAMRLAPHLQVLLRPGHAPALVAKLRHYTDREFAGLADG